MSVFDVGNEDLCKKAAAEYSILSIQGIKSRFSCMLEVSSHKVSDRLFRSFQSMQSEKLRQRKENPYIIHPYSPFRWYWDMVMVMTLGITLLVLPVEIAFFSDAHDNEYMWMSINMIVDIIFLIDIAFNLRTGYLNAGVDKVEIDSKKVAKKYLSTWFCIDLISSVPLDSIYRMAAGTSETASFYLTLRILRFTKLLSLLRILRVARLVRYIHKIEELMDVDSKVISIMNLIMVIFLFCHWNGCLQYLAAFLEGFPEKSWVVVDRLVILTADNSTEVVVDIWTIYTRSLWRAMSHMLSIGYGTTSPLSNTDIWMVILSMMLGASFYALFIANLSGLIMSMNLSGKKYDEMIAEVKQYMRFRRVPMELQRRVLEYYEHKYQRKYFDESTILYDPTMLSHTLRQEILLHNCQLLVTNVPFLANSPPDFLYDVIKKLQFQVFFPRDVIVEIGKKGDSMYFIEHGLVEVKLGDGKVINTLKDGSYFGEIVLLGMTENRVANVEAIEICDVYCLKRADFDKVVKEYPQMKLILEKMAAQRMKELRPYRETSAENKSECHASNLTETILTPRKRLPTPETTPVLPSIKVAPAPETSGVLSPINASPTKVSCD